MGIRDARAHSRRESAFATRERIRDARAHSRRDSTRDASTRAIASRIASNSLYYSLLILFSWIIFLISLIQCEIVGASVEESHGLSRGCSETFDSPSVSRKVCLRSSP